MDRASLTKLIVAIVDDKDVHHVMTALTDQHIGVTQVSSTGGFILSGNSTLLIGVDEPRVPQVMTLITELAARRQDFVPYVYAPDMALGGLAEVEVGGFLVFVLNVVHFEQV